MTKIAVMRLPRNLESITIDDTHTAEEVKENTIDAPKLRSVYSSNGFKTKISAPLQT